MTDNYYQEVIDRVDQRGADQDLLSVLMLIIIALLIAILVVEVQLLGAIQNHP